MTMSVSASVALTLTRWASLGVHGHLMTVGLSPPTDGPRAPSARGGAMAEQPEGVATPHARVANVDGGAESGEPWTK